MFLDFNAIDKTSLAVIDDSGNRKTYEELLVFSEIYFSNIEKRTLIFILADNSYPSLAGLLASLNNKIVPLLLSSSIDNDFLKSLINKYKPEFLWLPKENQNYIQYENVFEYLNYKLVYTGYGTPALFSDLSLLLPTSGSTGSSKLVRHSYENLVFSAKNVAKMLEIDKKEKTIVILPIYYTMGLSVITSHLYAGATVLLTKATLTEKRFWDFIREEEATSFTGVPFSYEILHRLRFFRMDLPHLKTLYQGGGKLQDNLFIDFAQFAKNNGKRFIATYGQTEGTARMAFLPANLATEKIGSIGNAIPGARLSIIDDEGNEITKIETQGELIYRGNNVTLGYANNIYDLQKGDERKGFLKTGDYVKRDSDGYYYIIGRKNRFLKLYGLRVSLDELEMLIKERFKCDCVCAGKDDNLHFYIEDSKIVPDIKNYITQKTGILSHAFNFIKIDRIPKNEFGKVMYAALEQQQ